MKKLLCIALSLIALTFCGCGKKNEDDSVITTMGDFKFCYTENGGYTVMHKSKKSSLKWDAVSGYTPRLGLVNPDGDDTDELLLTLYTPGDAGKYVEQIRIIKADENSNLTEYVCPLTPDDFLTHISAEQTDQSTVRLTEESDYHLFGLQSGEQFDKIYIGDAVTYDLDGDLYATVEFGFYLKNVARPRRCGWLRGKVDFKNEKFSLNDVIFTEVA